MPSLIGDDLIAVRVEGSKAAQKLAQTLRKESTWLEIVPGLDSVTVQFDPLKHSPQSALQALTDLLQTPKPETASSLPPLDIDIKYGGEDGPDLAKLCQTLGLSEEAFIAKHIASLHQVEMIGFTPGFAYIGGLDPALSAPRLKQPRLRVPAGSVGISAAYTGLYALQGPGGWPLIGRALTPLFNAADAEPFKVSAGQPIHFKPC